MLYCSALVDCMVYVFFVVDSLSTGRLNFVPTAHAERSCAACSGVMCTVVYIMSQQWKLIVRLVAMKWSRRFWYFSVRQWYICVRLRLFQFRFRRSSGYISNSTVGSGGYVSRSFSTSPFPIQLHQPYILKWKKMMVYCSFSTSF
jgi:hypothetical protein